MAAYLVRPDFAFCFFLILGLGFSKLPRSGDQPKWFISGAREKPACMHVTGPRFLRTRAAGAHACFAQAPVGSQARRPCNDPAWRAGSFRFTISSNLPQEQIHRNRKGLPQREALTFRLSWPIVVRVPCGGSHSPRRLKLIPGTLGRRNWLGAHTQFQIVVRQIFEINANIQI